jgi:hypothetical protein
MGLTPRGRATVPVPLDEYPIHQTPLPMSRVASSDRNFYDRCYFNAHDRTGEVFLVTGLGVYPNLGVIDAFAVARLGDRQWSVRFSDALSERGLDQQVGDYRIEVVEPLRRLHLACQSPDASLDFDLHWTGSFPAVQEEPHLLMSGGSRSSTRHGSASSAAGVAGSGSATATSPSPRTAGPVRGTDRGA